LNKIFFDFKKKKLTAGQAVSFFTDLKNYFTNGGGTGKTALP
jgi:hypothetical protein